ncbi:DUF4333 domain-containing protein [Blastococcus capsensis]|uniref:DUF4333 domain-containing protein n=1 Tax=Blastococcus capsensis TaxID=1564163 RepID=UPI002540C5D5|nr:DUF4333 domain-containing protein [Blastococcus capsensis]MDK3254891.1 DUF4333 domain-containing protein [Blastococcus capsensis]
MTNPPHGDAEPDGSPVPGPGGRPPGAGQPPAGSPPYGAPAWGQHPWPQPGAAPGGPPFGATQPYGQLPADFGPRGQLPLPPRGQQYGQRQQYGQPPAGFGPPVPPGGAPYGVPGYGAPGHGGPWQAPARRRIRASLFAALTALAVLIGIAVLALSTGPTVLSRAAVEQDVAAQFERREGVAVDLQCAQEMAVEEGSTYECTGVTADDEQVTLQIEITDEDGAHYTWTEP